MARVLITTPYFHPAIGGLEEYALRIATGLAARGWDVHVATSGRMRSTDRVGGLTVHRLPVSTQIANTPVGFGWVRQLRALIGDLEPRVINAHAPVPSMAAATIAASGARQLALTYHAGSMRKGRLASDIPIAAYERWVLPWMIARSAVVICSSSFVRDGLLAPWAAKSIVITPAVDAAVFKEASADAKPCRLVAVGDFRDPRKGLDYLLKAMESLPWVDLTVVGHAPPVAMPNVKRTGPMDRMAVIAELQRSAALILPSISEAESFGMVLIEAMACGFRSSPRT